MTRRLLLVRHGQTHYNATMRMQGQLNTELSDRGRVQAATAAQALAKRTPIAIGSSDLTRAMDTAKAIAEATNLTVSSDERLRETDLGQWQGKTHLEVDQQTPGARAAWRNAPLWSPPGGESRLDVARRARPVVDEAVEAFDNWAGHPIVLVAHGGLISALTAALLELPIEQFSIFNGIGNTRWVQLSSHPRPSGTGNGSGEYPVGPLPPTTQAAESIIWRLDMWNAGVDVNHFSDAPQLPR